MTAMDNTTEKLRQLFEAMPPGELRIHIRELYFRYLLEVRYPDQLPEITEAVYLLLRFLDEVEEGEC